MCQYIEFVADRLIEALGMSLVSDTGFAPVLPPIGRSHGPNPANAPGYSKIFHAHNPFDWMELISLQGKASELSAGLVRLRKAESSRGIRLLRVARLVVPKGGRVALGPAERGE